MPGLPRVAVLGAGAVGCYYGGMLARAGAPVTLIGRPNHVAAIQRNGLWFESPGFNGPGYVLPPFEGYIPVAASTEVEAVRDAQLVLCCVKSTDTERAAREMAPLLPPEAMVLSLQNGVDNAGRLKAVLGPQGARVASAVVYVACTMAGDGRVRHNGAGHLVIGDGTDAEGLRSLAGQLVSAGIPCRVSDNIDGELWVKLIMNCAYNAISALGRARYHRIVEDPDALELMRAAVREVLAVAQAAGVRMPPGDHVEAACRLADSMPQATSSTAQDIARGRPTEIAHLNGHVAALGERLGVPVPVNRTLTTLVRLLERQPAA